MGAQFAQAIRPSLAPISVRVLGVFTQRFLLHAGISSFVEFEETTLKKKMSKCVIIFSWTERQNEIQEVI